MVAEELLGERMFLGALHGLGRGEGDFIRAVGDGEVESLIFDGADGDVEGSAIGNQVAGIGMLEVAADGRIVGFPDDSAEGDGGKVDRAWRKSQFEICNLHFAICN